MAHITLAGVLLDPTGEFSVGDKVRFTHQSTTGNTMKSAVSVLKVPPNGVYSINLEYGLVLVEYNDYRLGQYRNLGIATVNATNTAISIPELLNALVPVSSAELIQFQAIQSNCVTAQNAATASASAALVSQNAAAASAATLDLINDLSQAYIFDTVAAYQASTIVFPVGKTIHLNDRQADFTVITGTTSNDGVIVSTEVNQSIELLDDIGLVNMGCVLDGVTDDTVAFMEACSLSRSRGVPIRETQVGILKYSTPADFTANGAGLIWAGVSKCVLLYGGVAGSDGVIVDNGGVHRVYTVTGQVGSFQYGETIIGGTTGRKGTCRQRFDSHSLEIYALGSIPDIETITGETSGATAQVAAIGSDTIYGSSLQDIKLKGFTVRADRTQNLDVNNNPLDWAESTGIYLNAFRNGCEVKDVRPEGFRYGHYSKFCWIGKIHDLKTHLCWAGNTWDSECNNMDLLKNSSSRSGSVADGSGWGGLLTSSYSTVNKLYDHEKNQGAGLIYENVQACKHDSGDIESNAANVRQLIVRGLPSADFTSTEKIGWTRGFLIDNPRFRKDVGIEFQNGVSGCKVSGGHWSDDVGSEVNSLIARIKPGATFIENINFDDSNSYYGQNDTFQPDIPLSFRASEWLENERAKWFNVLSQPLSISDANSYPVANLPTGAVITQVDYMADNSDVPTAAGTFEFDLGIGSNIGAFYVNDVVTVPTGGYSDVISSPYGLYRSKTAGISESSAGVVRARIQVNSAGTGKIILRIWYKIKF
jgi:hypothetical protein